MKKSASLSIMKLLHGALVFAFTLAVVLSCASSNTASESNISGPAAGSDIPAAAYAVYEEETISAPLSVWTPRIRAADEAKGKIVIYTSMYEEVFEAVERAMIRHFPALDVMFAYGGTGQIHNTINTEIASGRLGCDILMVAEPSYSIELKEKGLLHPYKSPEAQFLDFEYDPEGYWYPVRVSNMVFAYNPERFGIDNVPQSFYEFAYSPDLRNTLSMNNPNTSGTAMTTINALWDRYSQRYFEALGRQGAAIETPAESIARLENGQRRAAMILEESILKKRQEEGSKLEVIYPSDGAVVIPSTIAIVNDQWNASRNIPSAEAIVDWFLSEEGQDVIVSGWMHSVRKDFPRHPYDSVPTIQLITKAFPITWENVYRHRDEIRGNFQRLVAGRR